jgi:hypothetical protein
MRFTQFLTRAQSALSINATISDTSIVVADGTSFNQFPTMLLIDNELILAISKATSVTPAAPASIVQVVRAQEGTIASSHIVGAQVTSVLTAGSLNNRLSNVIQYGPLANVNLDPPSDTGFYVKTNGAGRIYLASDAPVLYMDNGGTSLLEYERWHEMGGSVSINWINQGSSSFVEPNSPTCLQINAGPTLHDHLTGVRTFISSDSLNPNTGALTCRLLCVPKQATTTYYEYGLYFCDSAFTKFVTLAVRIGDTISPQLRSDKWSNPTTVSSNYFSMGVFLEQVKYFKLHYNFSFDPNMHFFIGPDPSNMIEIFSVAASDFIIAPNQFGPFVNARQANASYLLFDYYSVFT